MSIRMQSQNIKGLFNIQQIPQQTNVFSSANPDFNGSVFSMNVQFNPNQYLQNGYTKQNVGMDEDDIQESICYEASFENRDVRAVVREDDDGNFLNYDLVSLTETTENGDVKTTKIVDLDCDGCFDYYATEIVDNNGAHKQQISYTFEEDGTIDVITNKDSYYNYENNLICNIDEIDSDADGQVNFIQKVVNFYHENGELSSEKIYKDANEDGIFDEIKTTEYNTDGLMTSVSRAKDSNFNETMDLTSIEEFDENGNIINRIINNSVEMNFEVDGFKQGLIGDCWLLAGLDALSVSEQGREIIKNAISQNDDGSYTVQFAGTNQEIRVTPEEIAHALLDDLHLKGDHDALLFELAFEKAFNELKDKVDKSMPFYDDFTNPRKGDKNILDGGRFGYVTYMLTGERVRNVRGFDENQYILTDFAENPQKYAIIASCSPTEKGAATTITDINGNTVELSGTRLSHAWAISAVDGDIVTLINPANTFKEIKVDKNAFCEVSPVLQFFTFE